MDPVNGVGQIVQILRRKLGERRVDRSSTDSSSKSAGTNRTRKAPAEEIRRRIGTRIGELDEDDRTGPKAAQIFVESVIAWEFGDDVLQDPEFGELAREVAETITGNDQSSARLKSLLGDLSIPPT